MGAPSGLASQFGVAKETVYGTPVTVNRFYEFVPPLAPKYDIERMKSKALRANTRVQRSDRWKSGKRGTGGDVTVELGNQGMGFWFEQMFGGVVTTQPAAGPSPTVYKHTFTPGDLTVGFTAQVGRPATSATVLPFTYTGSKLTEWELACAVGEFATIKSTFVGREEKTDIALATANYPVDVDLLSFVEGSVSIGGGAALVKKFSLKGGVPQDTDRYFLGSAFRQRPLENDIRPLALSLDMEFESLTQYDRYKSGEEVEIVLDFVGGIIEDALPFSCTISMVTRYDGATPPIDSAGVLQQNIPAEIVNNGADISVAYQTTDATP